MIIHKAQVGHDKCFMTIQTAVRPEKNFTLIDVNFTMTQPVKKLMVCWFLKKFMVKLFTEFCKLLQLSVEPQIEISGKFKTIILNSRKVFCKIVKNPSLDPGMYNIYKQLTGLGNLPKTCPIAIGVGLNITF